ncbi:hypothetical protein C8F01DRAFT_1107992 [Mycena amicta]|nr:hypothetical protein C8F01DRAFT_1107992 [Mycena amicta]
MAPKSNTARTWGTRFDTLPSSPPPSPPPTDVAPNSDAQSFKKTDKTPHDASVFVGSLPTNIEHLELSRLLAEHLSEHAEVKNVKLVKDSKNGVCAFVQCESAAAASALISTLQSSVPKPFFGRVLRYEPARAFRTLLISYRPPVQFIPATNGKDGEAIQLDLPHAMRMWRPRNSKYLSILYNDEAVEAENSAMREPASNPVLFLQPVLLDQATIERLCAHFGPLEHFGSLNKPDANQGDQQGQRLPYPPPHDGPRLPEMDTGCFEVKWVHRDDSVSALMTLRRVPHLTVTWAHQLQHVPDYYYQGRFPNNPHTHTNSFHLQNAQGPARPMPSTPSEPRMSLTTADDWHIYGDDMTARTFPPLGDRKSDRRAESGVWGDKKPTNGDAEEMIPSSLSVVIADDKVLPCDNAEFTATASAENHEHERAQELDMPDTPGLGMSPVTPKTTDSHQFPTTPTSVNEEIGRLAPTSLFVGGLEMFGPDAWDEDRVAALFGKYGGLENVTLVKPANARAAFAFVKFNNTESPAHAVYKEHNSVHHGRTIRVQLRDCNPPRGNWRFNGHRGRGRFPHYGQRRENPQRPEAQQDNSGDVGDEMAGNDASVEEPATEAVATDPKPVYASVGKFLEVQSRSAPVSRQTTPEPDPAPDSAPSEYREWYDEPASATMTPPLNAVVPDAPYGGYYPAPWPHHPYGMPYYPGYPIQGPHPHPQSMPSPGGSDASGPTSVPPPRPWPMYGYVHYPYARPPSVEKPSPVSPSQAPLQPTGFIQNGLGTLIPVYQPEALDQYMSSNPSSQSSAAQPQAPPPLPMHYQQYPPPAYAFANQMQPMMGIPHRPFPAPFNEAWVPQTQLLGPSRNLPPVPNLRPAFPDVTTGPNNNRRQAPPGGRRGGNNGPARGMNPGRQHYQRGGLHFPPNNANDMPQMQPQLVSAERGQWISTATR